ncbi:hypothetical protein C5C06_11030, partial [Rathayibacter tritici]
MGWTMSAEASETALKEVRARADRASALARSAAPILLGAADELYASYTAALARPESFARGRSLSRSEAGDLVERSIRAELAVSLGVSERVAARELEQARLLAEDLPRTRAALAEARIRWEAGQVICGVARTLPADSRAAFDQRAADAAVSLTPTRLRSFVAQLRDEVHEEPLAERHARARDDRSVWVGADADGMATLCARLPAPVALGAFIRLDRIARALRENASTRGQERDAEARTMPQLRADALADLLCDGDVSGTTPGGDELDTTFVPGVRAEVRLTLPARTAAGLDDAPAHLDGYGLIPAVLARELAGVATSFTRVLTDPVTGAVLSVGRTLRVPPPRMRLHLQLRDVTCRFPGCTRPASTTEADHALEWRNGGETALRNLLSLCVAHHHVRHGDRWTYVLHADGTADWTTPTGRRVTTRPPALPGAPPRARPPLVDELDRLYSAVRYTLEEALARA